MSESRLTGKRTLVTGSGTGIGREIALEFARQGADVVLHYSHSDAGAVSAMKEIAAMGRRTAVFKADFDSVNEAVQLGRQAMQFLGGIDCLVNNSGITFNKPFLEVTPAQFDVLYHVNVRAQFFLTQQIVADMLTHGGGAVCNITSIHGFQGAPEHSVYAGTKGAIIAYTRTLAIELAHQGVRVNAIAPGWVTVENYYKWMPWFNETDAAETARNKVPAARAGRPPDIAKLAVFLCSDDASYIIGQTIVADGGTTALMSLLSNFRDRSAVRCGVGYVPGLIRSTPVHDSATLAAANNGPGSRKPNMIQKLTEVLNSVHHPTRLYRTPDGTRVLILPHGGRIIGLFAPHSDHNFLWTHPALGATESASRFYGRGEWENPGGDRTWVSPETDFFFPDFPDTSRYLVQPAVDPGNYQLTRSGSVPRLTNLLRATLSRSKQEVDLEVTKWIEPASNPLRHERTHQAWAAVEYAGYTLRTSLKMRGSSRTAPVRVGLWHLLQLPHGGDMLVPTYTRSVPRVYMGSISPDDLIVDDRLIRYRMRAGGNHKIGIRAVAVTGRAGYLYRTGEQWALVIRCFAVAPSGEYVDTPWDDVADLGYCFQACSINDNRLGQFSELESHVPAIGKDTGQSSCEDVSAVWAYRGTWPQVSMIADALLGVRLNLEPQ